MDKIISLYNTIGDFFNNLFEHVIMQWYYDDGLIYFNGRDIIAFIIGFLCCLVLVMFIISISENVKKRKSMKNKKNRRK